MIQKINDILAGLPATIVGGVFLVMSFVFPRVGVALPVDPAWVTVIICGLPLIYLAIYRIIYNPGISKISSVLLISIAMLASIAVGDLFAAGEVAFIMEIGAILEDMTTNRAKKGLKKLISLVPTQGRRIVNGREEMVSAEKICQGDLLRILPGEIIPVDGKIVTGTTSVDQSIMTGESLPVDKMAGDELFCGTINCFGAVDITATNVGRDSSLQKLIGMVEEAEEKKAPMARVADKAATWLVPFIVVVALLTGVISRDWVRAVTILVVFCPCALVLATPTAIMAAVGQATRHGVIIKSGEALEKMGRVDTIAFDKTGTLTYGKLEVSDVLTFDSHISEQEVLMLTAAAEERSEHPLGKAIVRYAKAKHIDLPAAEDFRMTAGRGIAATVNGKQLLCGSESYLQEQGVALTEQVSAALDRLRTEGKASILTAADGKCIGVLAMADQLRPEAKEVVARLHSMDTSVALLTGDNEKTADYFARQVGITDIHARLLPGEKVTHIAAMQADGRQVCMIGDGVNDAPALKTAGVGVAMGSMGSDIAVEAADIALMSDDIARIPYLKRLSNATIRTIQGSIALSMTINFCAVILSMAGILTPTTGALVHNAGSCLVVLIAALLYDRKFE